MIRKLVSIEAQATPDGVMVEVKHFEFEEQDKAYIRENKRVLKSQLMVAASKALKSQVTGEFTMHLYCLAEDEAHGKIQLLQQMKVVYLDLTQKAVGILERIQSMLG